MDYNLMDKRYKLRAQLSLTQAKVDMIKCWAIKCRQVLDQDPEKTTCDDLATCIENLKSISIESRELCDSCEEVEKAADDLYKYLMERNHGAKEKQSEEKQPEGKEPVEKKRRGRPPRHLD